MTMIHARRRNLRFSVRNFRYGLSRVVRRTSFGRTQALCYDLYGTGKTPYTSPQYLD